MSTRTASLTLTDVARQPIRDVPMLATLREAAVELSEEQVGAVLVRDGGRIVGILTELDLARVVGDGGDVDEERVRDHMTDQVVTIDSGLGLREASRAMEREGIRHLLVTNGGEAMGVISVRDVLRWFHHEDVKQAAAPGSTDP